MRRTTYIIITVFLVVINIISICYILSQGTMDVKGIWGWTSSSILAFTLIILPFWGFLSYEVK